MKQKLVHTCIGLGNKIFENAKKKHLNPQFNLVKIIL